MNVYIIELWKGGKTVEIEIKLLEQMAKNNVRQIRALSQMSGVSEQSISKLLNEKSKYMRLDSLAKLCGALDCEIGDLIEFKK
jgi:putative transcriptional regulator